jgi:hypothetical protein
MCFGGLSISRRRGIGLFEKNDALGGMNHGGEFGRGVGDSRRKGCAKALN